MKNVIILGAGFAGVQTALHLAKRINKFPDRRIILIDKNSFHLYTPALYEVASAYRWRGFHADLPQEELEALLGAAVSLSLREIVKGKNILLVQDEIAGVDIPKKSIYTASGDKIDFEYLCFALGAETTFFEVRGAEQYSIPLKNIDDALKIRERVELLFKNGTNEKPVSIIVAGGGFTGIEITAELARYIEHIGREKGMERGNVRITLVEAGERILKGAPEKMVGPVEDRLKNLGVDIRTGVPIVEVQEGGAVLKNNERLDAGLVVWAGGVRGCSTCRNIFGLEIDKRGRVVVDEYLRAKGHYNVFALGDVAAFKDPESGLAAPGTAWAAEQEAEAVAENLIRSLRNKPLKSFRISFPGYVAAVGGKYAVAYVYGITLRGALAWLLRRFIDLKYLISVFSWSQAFRIWLREWQLFTKND